MFRSTRTIVNLKKLSQINHNALISQPIKKSYETKYVECCNNNCTNCVYETYYETPSEYKISNYSDNDISLYIALKKIV